MSNALTIPANMTEKGKSNIAEVIKWHNMSPEEREKMKEEWRNKCRSWRKPNTPTQEVEQ